MDDDRGVYRAALRRQRPTGVPAGRAGGRHRGDLRRRRPTSAGRSATSGGGSSASQLIAALFVQAAVPSGAIAAVAVGTLSAAIVHLVVRVAGRPADRVADQARSRRARRRTSTSSRRRRCNRRESCCSRAGISTGPLLVKVYGRDAWDAQLLTSLWRTAWYRGGERGAGRSRVDLVEHEGFVTLLAERAGVRVPRLVTAGSAGRGDALVVVRPEGRPLASSPRQRRRDAAHRLDVDPLWHELASAARRRHRPPPARPRPHRRPSRRLARLRRPVVGVGRRGAHDQVEGSCAADRAGTAA